MNKKIIPTAKPSINENQLRMSPIQPALNSTTKLPLKQNQPLIDEKKLNSFIDNFNNLNTTNKSTTVNEPNINKNLGQVQVAVVCERCGGVVAKKIADIEKALGTSATGATA
jgi:hypothetical protein